MIYNIAKRFRWSLAILSINCFWIGTQMPIGHALVTCGAMVAWMHIRDFERENLAK